MKKLIKKLVRLVMIIVIVIAIVLAVAYGFPDLGLYLTQLLATFSAALTLSSLAWIALAGFIVCMILDPDEAMSVLSSVAGKFAEAAATVASAVLEPVAGVVTDLVSNTLGKTWMWLLGGFIAYKLVTKGESNATNREPVVTRDSGENQRPSETGSASR